MTLGVARYSADPDRRSAEFAVAVRSDWHGRGVGQLLMARLTEIAERKVRRRQLTDDGNVEITGRDLREREIGSRHPNPIDYRCVAS